jgi:hypothetical protein
MINYNVDIDKVFAEIGKLHMQISVLQERVTSLEAELQRNAEMHAGLVPREEQTKS